jgi:predicted permease
VIAVLGALAPIFLLIVLGFALRRTGFLAEGFWAPVEKLTYYILFPALLLTSLAEARLDGAPVAAVAGAQVGGVVAMGALALLLRPLLARPPFRLDGPAFTSVFQGMIRPNTYVGLAAAAGIFGQAGLALTAFCVAVVVMVVNLVCVAVLVRYAGKGGRRPGLAETLAAVVRNPLIASCLVGLAMNFAGVGFPPMVAPFLKALASASLPMGLLAVGAGLRIDACRQGCSPVVLTVGAKLLALPFVVAGIGRLLGLDAVSVAVCATYAALPCAPNAYILARQLGGDAEVAAGIITVQTMAAAVTMPLVVMLLT